MLYDSKQENYQALEFHTTKAEKFLKKAQSFQEQGERRKGIKFLDSANIARNMAIRAFDEFWERLTELEEEPTQEEGEMLLRADEIYCKYNQVARNF